MIVRAPANVKISGEHSVVYGGLSLSVAINLYAKATVSDTGGDALEVMLNNLGITASFGIEALKRMYEDYSARNTSDSGDLLRYIEKYADVGYGMLPYATIASRLFADCGVNPVGKRVVIDSEVPLQKGYASSAVCSAAFTMALVKSSGERLDDKAAIDIIRDGERIVHRVETAGRIDVGPSYFGGYATYSSSSGVRREDIDTELNLVIIDTGPKPQTSEMLKKVRQMYEHNTSGTVKIFGEIDDCVIRCIDALKRGDMKGLGKQMSRNHDLLRMIGVSSEGLDRAVSTALDNGAYGAKMCGGGGGGMAIALAKDRAEIQKLIYAMKAEGFDAREASISFDGAKS